jgi:hypothetical protein
VAGRITVGTSHRIANTLLRGYAARFARYGRNSIWDVKQTRPALAQALADSEQAITPATRVSARARDGAQRAKPPSGSIRRWRTAAACSRRRSSSYRRACWAEVRDIARVEVNLEVVRDNREPDLTLSVA